MIPRQRQEPFYRKLTNFGRELEVHASFGHYKVAIQGSRLEIHGAMHHLFIGKNKVAPHPTQTQIHNNLQGLIILRNLKLHLEDPSGTGKKLVPKNREQAICPGETINMAGPEGELRLKRMEVTGKLAKAIYKIVQEDILNALANKQYTINANAIP